MAHHPCPHNHHHHEQKEEPLPDDEAFNALIREWILTLVVFLGLYVTSYITLRRFFRFRPTDVDEQDRSHIPLVLSASGLAVSFGAMMLVPFTILGYEVIDSYRDCWYVKWISYDLILGLWNKIFWGANLSLFLVLPLAYFYYEAEGLGGKGALARLYEALVVFALVSCMLAGLVYLLSNSLSLPTSQYLIFSYSLISMLGSLLFLCTAPLGMLRLASFAMNVGGSRGEHGNLPLLRDNRNTLHPSVLPFERTALRLRLSERQSKPEIAIALVHRLNACEDLTRRGQPTQWRIYLQRLTGAASLLLRLFTFFLSAYTVMRTAIHLFVGLLLAALLPSLSRQLRNGATVTLAELQLSGLGTLLDSSAVIYLIPSILLGFYSLPGLGRLRPVVGKTSMAGVVANTAAIVLMASSFPVVVDLLGLSRLDLMGAFGCASYARDPWFAGCYCFAFLITSAMSCRSLLSAPPPSWHRKVS